MPSLELHNHEHHAVMVFDRPATEQAMAAWLLLSEPVACGEAGSCRG